MKLIRQSQSCDIEVEINPKSNGMAYGFSYTIRSFEEGGLTKVWANNANAVDTYAVLSDLYANSDVRVPAKFVIEFANYAIAELSNSIAVQGITSGSTVDAEVVYEAGAAE